MKKYTHYRVSLLIGLLSLQILSACVQTSQELGIDREQLGSTFDNIKINYNHSPTKFILYTGGAVVTLVTTAASIWGLNHYFGTQGDPINPGMRNDSSVTTTMSPLTSNKSSTNTMLYTNMTPEQAESITQAIEEGGEKWDTHETSSNGYINTTTTTSTTQAPEDDVTVANAMVLDEQVMSDLKAHGFSKERIEYWMARGLSANARNEKNGNTLLYEVAYEPNEGAVRELLKIPGIDLSVEGYVDLLQWAVANGYSGIATLILASNLGNIDSKDSDDNNLWHLAAKSGSLNLLEALENRLTILILQEKNKDGKTPVEVAEENGHQAAVDALQKMIHSSER